MQILFEDYYLLIVNKPAGLSSESGGARHPSAEREALFYFTQHLQQTSASKKLKATPFLRAAHRLDRVASGILVFAKTKTALTHLMEQFEKRETQKTYLATVEKRPPADSGTLSHWLKKSPDGKQALISQKGIHDAQWCELEYKLLEMKGKNALLEVRPLTGRFHQIRAQLADIGCPIVGDEIYGGHFWKENQIKLHACRLKFRHPKTGEPVELESLPDEAWR